MLVADPGEHGRGALELRVLHTPGVHGAVWWSTSAGRSRWTAMVSCSRWTRSGRAERSRGNLPLAAAWPPSGHRDPSTARGSSAQLRVGAVGVRDAAGADRPAARPQRHRGHRARPPPPTAPGPGGRRHGDGRPLPAASTAVVTRLVAHAGRQAVSARLLHEFTCGGGGGRPVATAVVARRLLHRPGARSDDSRSTPNAPCDRCSPSAASSSRASVTGTDAPTSDEEPGSATCGPRGGKLRSRRPP